MDWIDFAKTLLLSFISVIGYNWIEPYVKRKVHNSILAYLLTFSITLGIALPLVAIFLIAIGKNPFN